MAAITKKTVQLHFHCDALKKCGGVYWFKTTKTYKKLKNRGWYSKGYWYFNVTTTNDSNNDNTPASTVTATANH